MRIIQEIENTSPFLNYTQPADLLLYSYSADDDTDSEDDDTDADEDIDSSEKVTDLVKKDKVLKKDKGKKQVVPASTKLCYLRVELERIRGMQDFLIRVATPPKDGKNTIVTLRANKSNVGKESLGELVKVIGVEMDDKKDKTFDWSKLNVDHTSKILGNCLKFFSTNTGVEYMKFTTEALL
jgi:hypothetical protein